MRPASAAPQPPRAPEPAIVYANYLQFEPAARAAHPRVQSRMLLWCRAGRGTVEINGERLDIAPHQWLFLPWGHSIEYRADHRDPFLLAGVHIIPWMRPGAPIEWQLAHRAADPLFDSADRADAPLRDLDGLRRSSFDRAHALRLLANYLVELHVRGGQSESSSRALAPILLDEVRAALASPHAWPSEMPAELERLLVYIADHLADELSIDDLIDVSGRSASTIGRLFRAQFGIPPSAYILELRIERAKELLRTTRHSVAEVGRLAGIRDPYYFSRVFRQRVGVAPLAFRKKSELL